MCCMFTVNENHRLIKLYCVGLVVIYSNIINELVPVIKKSIRPFLIIVQTGNNGLRSATVSPTRTQDAEAVERFLPSSSTLR